jgi:hypothetical protein
MRRGQRRIGLDKHMNVIRHDLEPMYGAADDLKRIITIHEK